MGKVPEKKFLIKLKPVPGDVPRYWLKAGYSNTENIHQAHKYRESDAMAIAAKEPEILELVPV